MKIRAKTGDIFQIPISDTEFSFGQVVVKNKGALCIVTFDGLHKYDDHFTTEQILKSKIILPTDTMDAKIWNGDWMVYSNTPVVDTDLSRPNFKVGLDPVFITDYSGQKVKVATEQENGFYDYKFSVAPIRVQNTMKAYFKLADWDPDFDKLTYNYCAEKSILTK